MSHSYAIDLRSINYINCKCNFDEMVELVKLNDENLYRHVISFCSFINNLKTLIDSLLFEYGKSNTKKNIIEAQKSGLITDNDLKMMDDLKKIRDYLIHHKELSSYIFGTQESYVYAIKNRKEFLKYQESIDPDSAALDEKKSLSLMLKYLDKNNARKLIELSEQLRNKVDTQINTERIIREV